MKEYFKRMEPKGKCPPRVPIKKIVWSWLGSFLGIYLVGLYGLHFNSLDSGGLFLIGSFGASAVLIYGAPLAIFSQPRNLVGGHVLSAFVGVSVYMIFQESSVLASALAVSLSIVLMHFTATMHPPGGATALIAVIGGYKVHSLGYGYILNPVFSGALIMLLVALAVNNLSTNPNRHYPDYWI